MWLKTRLPWKIGRRLHLLWRHSSVAWPHPVNFLPEVAQMMLHKLCKVSAWSSQRFGGHSRKTHGGLHHPPARARVEKKKNNKYVDVMPHSCHWSGADKFKLSHQVHDISRQKLKKNIVWLHNWTPLQQLHISLKMVSTRFSSSGPWSPPPS